MAVPHYEFTKQRVQNWWLQVRSQYRGVFRLAQSDKESFERIRDLPKTLYQIKQAYDVFDTASYPSEADMIRRHLLATMTNLIACLQHACHDNYHERDVLFEIMQVDMHMLEMSLMEQDIPPLS
jgi:hypothetical protein